MPRAREPRRCLLLGLLVEGRPVLVVGGGAVAERKVQALLEAGAAVTVVAPRIGNRLREWADEGRLTVAVRPYLADDQAGQFLVLAATDDPALNEMILRSARANGLLAGSVDRNWRQGDFLLPASERSAGVQLAVTTDGGDPPLAGAVRRALTRHVSGLLHTEALWLALPEDQHAEALLRLPRLGGILEWLVLPTGEGPRLIALADPEPTFRRLLLPALGLPDDTDLATGDDAVAAARAWIDRHRRRAWSLFFEAQERGEAGGLLRRALRLAPPKL